MREIGPSVVLASCLIGCGSVSNPVHDAGPDSASSPDASAPVDTGASATSYDVAYISKVTLTPNISAVKQFVALVNRGTEPLPLSSVMVKNVSDDNSGVDWAFTLKVGSTVMLKPGRAAGHLSPLAQDVLVSSGTVPEPFDDQLLDFEMRFPSPPPAGLVLRGQAVLDINGADATLVYTIQVAETGDIVFENAKRTGSQQ